MLPFLLLDAGKSNMAARQNQKVLEAVPAYAKLKAVVIKQVGR